MPTVNERCKILRSLNRVYVFEIVLLLVPRLKILRRRGLSYFGIFEKQEAQSSSQETNHNITHTHPSSTPVSGLVTCRTDTCFTVCTCHVPATAWRVEVTPRREKTDGGNSASLYTDSEVCSSKPPAMPGRTTDLSFSSPYKYRVLTSDPQVASTQQQANSASWCYQTHAPTCLSCVTYPCLFSSISIRTAHPLWKRILPCEASTRTTDQCNEGRRTDELVNPSLYMYSEVCFITHPQFARVCRVMLPLSATGCLHDKGDGPPGSYNRA